VVKRLLGRPARFAGDEAMRERERVFGVVHFEQDPPVFDGVSAEVARRGAQSGYEAATTQTYTLDIPKLPERAQSIVAQLEEADVTTVIFLGDPIMPIYLTKAATEQGYFPEWLVTGTVLTDTTVLGRLYDQRQWAHAFGLSSLAGRTPRQLQEGWRLHEWYYDEPPAAAKTSGIIYPAVHQLMIGIHLAGPKLSAATFQGGMFGYPPSGGGPTTPRVSYGDHGTFEEDDYVGVDDTTEIWWDADAVGPDEQDVRGTGMWRYANGGRRYLPGEMPAEEPDAFVEEGSVTLFAEIPPEDRPPDYPPPR
jgi:hypothetical protein